jgi:hypothetical protein
VYLRAEAFTGSEDEAQRVTEKLKTFLAIFGSAESSVSVGSDPDVKQLFASLKVEQHRDRSVVTATVPTNFIRKLVAEAPNEVEQQKERQAPAVPPQQKKPDHK